MMKTAAVLATAALTLGAVVAAHAAQAQTERTVPAPDDTVVSIARVPFGPGEKVSYRVSWGPMRGSATSEVLRVDTVRGRPSYHLSFHVRGGMLGLNVNDHQESWLDIGQLYSHRFKQNLNQPRYRRLRTLDFFPAERMWRQVEAPTNTGELASDRPLDDVSFLYWVRTLPLEVGRTYEFNRYYKESGNPVKVQVLRREQIRVRAGTFNTIVVRPFIRTSGLFAEAEGAEIWFSDDDTRLVVQMKTKVAIGTMTLELDHYTAGRLLASNGR
jgi:hypothetical protein